LAANDKRAGGDSAANMRITLKYPDVKAFVEKFATNVSRGGIFIASRTPKSVGTAVRFELLLSDGKSRVLRGEGMVAWVREFDPRQPNRPHGMGIKFSKLDPESRKVVDRILAFKQERGVKEDSAVIPLPTAAARSEDSVVTPPPAPPPTAPEVESIPKAETTAPTPVAEGSAPRRLPPLSVSVEDINALLAADGPALEATLTRALAIARATAAGGGAGIEELEALLRQPDPDATTSVADAVAGLASMFGGSAPRISARPATPTAPPPAEPETTVEATREIVLEAEPPDATPEVDDTSPLSMAVVAAASSPSPAAGSTVPRSPFAAEDLGAGDLDPLDLEGLDFGNARPEIEPLPPPPHSAPHFRLDPAGLEDTGAGQEPAAPRPSPPTDLGMGGVPQPLDEEIEISGPEFALDDEEGTIVAPMAQFLEAEPPPPPVAADALPKQEKKGFFSKLFKKQ
jgi:molecular chaperone DnaK